MQTQGRAHAYKLSLQSCSISCTTWAACWLDSLSCLPCHGEKDDIKGLEIPLGNSRSRFRGLQQSRTWCTCSWMTLVKPFAVGLHEVWCWLEVSIGTEYVANCRILLQRVPFLVLANQWVRFSCSLLVAAPFRQNQYRWAIVTSLQQFGPLMSSAGMNQTRQWCDSHPLPSSSGQSNRAPKHLQHFKKKKKDSLCFFLGGMCLVWMGRFYRQEKTNKKGQ